MKLIFSALLLHVVFCFNEFYESKTKTLYSKSRHNHEQGYHYATKTLHGSSRSLGSTFIFPGIGIEYASDFDSYEPLDLLELELELDFDLDDYDIDLDLDYDTDIDVDIDDDLDDIDLDIDLTKLEIELDLERLKHGMYHLNHISLQGPFFNKFRYRYRRPFKLLDEWGWDEYGPVFGYDKYSYGLGGLNGPISYSILRKF